MRRTQKNIFDSAIVNKRERSRTGKLNKKNANGFTLLAREDAGEEQLRFSPHLMERKSENPALKEHPNLFTV